MLALFGKIPAKRDFVARNMSSAALSVVEPFLQAAVAEGRQALGPAWTEQFLVAPIWRFWWSHGICGAGAKGAVMPSVDAVGRYFPLIALAFAAGRTDAAPPGPADDGWYGALEDALLSALREDGTLDDLLARLDRVAGFDLDTPSVAPMRSGTLWWTVPPAAAGKAAFADLPPARDFGLMLAGRAPAPSAAGEP